MTYGQELESLLTKILTRHNGYTNPLYVAQSKMEMANVVYALLEAVEGRDEESHDDNWLSIPVLIDSIKDWFPVEEEHI